MENKLDLLNNACKSDEARILQPTWEEWLDSEELCFEIILNGKCPCIDDEPEERDAYELCIQRNKERGEVLRATGLYDEVYEHYKKNGIIVD